MRKIFILTGVFVACMGTLRAQNLSSPYSAYGIGEIQDQDPDRSSGMGYTSTALLATPGFLINKNPASLIGLERSLAQVDLALIGKTVTFKGDAITTDNNKAKDLVIKRISVSAKINKHWASSIGFKPYTLVNYSYTAQKSIEGSNATYTGLYDGNGGLHNIFWNNAFAVGKHLALGLRSNFIFGSINQIETLQGVTLSTPIISQITNYYSGFRFEGGAIYGNRISKNWKFSVGGKVTTKTDLDVSKTLTVQEGTSVVESNKDLGDDKFTLPWQYDAGIALVNKGRTTFTVDYSRANWNGMNPGGTTWTMVDRDRYSAGVQFSNQVQRYGLVAEKSYFQAGLFTGQSYLQVKGQQIKEMGATLGYGGYVSRGLAFHLAAEGGTRGTMANNLVKETYFQFTLALSYREVLYSKGRKYD
ncbi:hypothetical protein A4H97_23010 [Niastella yeongjuensis]|uniref:DUF5723 domain-containing protein n=1 Tax=Niastella yeongjuensis TaxID=354355 RepID=A0A1V9F7L0_9BACT|nr:hypothetical protein [Niastella yeongjuensis]OQP54354.1 hypothetical protein A4H97_23010 [Niastella yeongjuensis]SEP29630.1 hypothetical protein SAMN05660816_05105 [Niastella yeongjuensis]